MADASLSVGGVYAIRNVINGRRYVGSAVSFKNRWAVHRHGLARGIHHGPALQRAWLKYGAEAFVFEVLEVVSKRFMLLTREQHWIDHFDAVRGGYNVSPTAGSTLGKKHSDAAKRRMSAAHKALLSSPQGSEARRRQLKATFGTPEQSRAQAEKAAAAWRDPEFRTAATQRAIKQTSNAEWRAAHSAKIKYVWADPARREAMCAAMRGKPSPRRKAMKLFGVRYESITAAAAAHGRNRDWVKARMEPA